MTRRRCSRAAILAICIAAAPLAGAWAGTTPAFDPADPGKSGYKLVFDDEFNNPGTIDWRDTRQAGFNWYLGGFFGGKTASAGALKVQNGVLTLAAADHTQIGTAGPLVHGHGWMGKVFGGGAYIEARLAFDPDQQPHPRAWPAFWSMAIEHMQGVAAGTFEHFIEDDFFEADTNSAGANSYGGAIHDWFGVYKVTCPVTHYCSFVNDGRSSFRNHVIHVATATDWRQFHIFGQLWQPASATADGHAAYYFDNKPTGDQVSWPANGNPGAAADAPFAVIDQDHLVIILETGGGQEMRVDWVKVWQKPGQADDQTR
jgi:hypothetical protein